MRRGPVVAIMIAVLLSARLVAGQVSVSSTDSGTSSVEGRVFRLGAKTLNDGPFSLADITNITVSLNKDLDKDGKPICRSFLDFGISVNGYGRKTVGEKVKIVVVFKDKNGGTKDTWVVDDHHEMNCPMVGLNRHFGPKVHDVDFYNDVSSVTVEFSYKNTDWINC